MRGYVLPGVALVAAILLAYATDAGFGGDWSLTVFWVAVWGYAAAALWWAVAAVKAGRPLLLHMGALWLPAIAPLAVVLNAMRETDAAALGFFTLAPAIFIPALAGLVGTFLLITRAMFPGTPGQS